MFGPSKQIIQLQASGCEIKCDIETTVQVTGTIFLILKESK